MTWDYAETNPFSNSTGSLNNLRDRQVKGFQSLVPKGFGSASQADAAIQEITANKIVSTDPPYYDNICYADLSDFFYIWLRYSMKPIFPNLFAMLVVPKNEELVTSPYHHSSKEQAEAFFLTGMTQAMHRLTEQALSSRSQFTTLSNSQRQREEVLLLLAGKFFLMQLSRRVSH